MADKNTISPTTKTLSLKELQINECYRCVLSNNIIVITNIQDDKKLGYRVTGKYFSRETGMYYTDLLDEGQLTSTKIRFK